MTIYDYLERPPKIRAGNVMTALINSNTPSTAMPNKRKGSINNHTMGYSTIAIKAMGQHKINNINQSNKFIFFPPSYGAAFLGIIPILPLRPSNILLT